MAAQEQEASTPATARDLETQDESAPKKTLKTATGRCLDICVSIGPFIALLLAIGAIVLVLNIDKRPLYSVAIDAFSGLYPAPAATGLGLRQPALEHPAFNLTLRAASRSFVNGECFRAGSLVAVAYRGVTLASAPARELCARPRAAAEQSVVAAVGAGVRVPGSLLDSLAADMRRGAEAFDVPPLGFRPPTA